MTLPTIVAVGAVAAGQGDVVPGLPSGWAANDIHLMVVEQSRVNNWGSPPSGWVLVTNCQQGAGTAATDGNIQIYWRRAVAGDADPTVTDTINHTSARIIGIRGCVTSGDPWDVSNGGTDTVSNTSVSITGNTTTVADCMIVLFGGTGTDVDSTAEWSGWTNADLANLTERMDDYNSQANGGGFACATGEKASIGAYTATTATLATAGTKAFATIALKPALNKSPAILTLQQAVKRSSTW